MEDERFQGLRAYENREWLQSRGARLVRIMSEFIEPADRLKQEKVSGSILVFGSARVKSPEQWKEIQENLENELIESPRKPEIIEKLRLHARLKSSSKYYHDVVELCRRLTEWADSYQAQKSIRRALEGVNSRWKDENVSLAICTGGGPGLMEAANMGASQVEGGKSMGMGISLPFEHSLNPYVTTGLGFVYNYFFTRKFWMAYLALGIVVTPGGFGTLDELMEILTLRQTGRIKKEIPIVLFGCGFWKSLVRFDYLVSQGVIDKADIDHL